MNCPYCAGEMQSGTIRFDGRFHIRWFPDGQVKTRSDRFWDALGGVGGLTAAQYNWSGVLGSISSDYCPTCKKMIFETDIEK